MKLGNDYAERTSACRIINFATNRSMQNAEKPLQPRPSLFDFS